MAPGGERDSDLLKDFGTGRNKDPAKKMVSPCQGESTRDEAKSAPHGQCLTPCLFSLAAARRNLGPKPHVHLASLLGRHVSARAPPYLGNQIGGPSEDVKAG